MVNANCARLTIDLDGLAANYATLREEAKGAEVAAVVKADGYGLGAGRISRRLWAEGVRSFYVARLEEGERLRSELGPQRPATIHVFDGFTPGSGPRLAAAALSPAISSQGQLSEAAAFARTIGQAVPCALQVDTGMNRQGLTPQGLRAAMDAADAMKGLEVRVLVSHLGSGARPEDPHNRLQLQRFSAVRGLFPEAKASFAASAGIFLGEGFRFDQVRAGISLYGGGPLEIPDTRLRAVALLEAPVLDIRNVAPGERIGYGARMIAQSPMRIAILGAGYADGVLRAGAGKAMAWCAGALRPIVMINMDLIAVDIGDAQLGPGDMVELLGPHALLDDQAAAAGTVAHECLTRLGERGERIYLGDGD